MKKITCDKCGAELNENTTFPIRIGGKVEEIFDLCGDCREALIDWLADGAPVELNEQPEETRRLAAVELMAMGGCSKSHVFKWFRTHGVTVESGKLVTFTDRLGRHVKRRVYELTEKQLADFVGSCRLNRLSAKKDTITLGIGNEKRKTMAEQDDPLYGGGPKNDKVGYTIEELMQSSGRDFYAVLAGLERLGVTPCVWKRDGKTFCKFYLSPGDLDRLSAD